MESYGILRLTGKSFLIHGNAVINVLNLEGHGSGWMQGFVEYVLQFIPYDRKQQVGFEWSQLFTQIFVE